MINMEKKKVIYHGMFGGKYEGVATHKNPTNNTYWVEFPNISMNDWYSIEELEFVD